ncbi:MAG: DUF3090 domain-containing protein [Nocardioidaceae bacterium]
MVTHEYDSPDRFVAGTVGPPGERTFFLQARDGSRVTSVALEKQQVEVLGERLGDLVEQIPEDLGGGGTDVPAVDQEPLDQPIDEEFRVGAMTLAWDPDQGVVVVEAFKVTEDEDEESDEALVVRLTPEHARAFSARAAKVVSAGRGQCQFCGNPMNPTGHICPRANGFLRVNAG